VTLAHVSEEDAKHQDNSLVIKQDHRSIIQDLEAIALDKNNDNGLINDIRIRKPMKTQNLVFQFSDN
jgi:hypothetical protein